MIYPAKKMKSGTLSRLKSRISSSKSSVPTLLFDGSSASAVNDNVDGISVFLESEDFLIGLFGVRLATLLEFEPALPA